METPSTSTKTRLDPRARAEPRVLSPRRASALKEVLDMLPDELHQRELLRPIDVGGKEMMRELGLRTRQYKKHFHAWQDLHLVEDASGEVLVRDDIIHHLRGSRGESLTTQGQAGNPLADPLGGASFAETLRTYEDFHEFMDKTANLLFPFTAPYFASHMSLLAHVKNGGRGIVLTAGDAQAPFLLTIITSFRSLGCKLPIEVMYLGDGDLGQGYQAELEVRCCPPLTPTWNFDLVTYTSLYRQYLAS